MVFFNDNLNEIKVCDFEINRCSNENLSIEEISLLFSGRLIKNGFFYIFISNNYQNYLNGSFLDNSKIIDENYNKMLIENAEILYTKGMHIIQDNKNKKIKFIQKDSSQIVLFRHGIIKNWEITFFGNKTNNINLSKNLYSGCINFYNIEFIDINLNVTNTTCDDSVNFVKTSGNIKNLNLNGSKNDAVDFDFSNIKVDKATVFNVKNDCIDMSYGNYNINQIIVKNCGDKGISVGEKSNFIGNNIKVENTLIGLATKDSSSSIIKILEIKDTKLCAAAYRKKQEFYGAEIIVNNFLCNKKEIYFQDGSNIKVINEL